MNQLLALLMIFLSASFAKANPVLKCDGIWEIDQSVPFVAHCPIVIAARVPNGPTEIRHLSRATADKCAYEDIISNVGGSNQIVCRVLR